MRLKTILLTTVATGTLMCEPVMAYAVDSTPDSMGWFRKKKKINPEKPDVPLNKNDAFQKVQKRRVQEKR